MANWRLGPSNDDYEKNGSTVGKNEQSINNKAEKKDDKKEETFFMISEPKYKISDLIISDKVASDLKMVINANQVWKKVFDFWDLSSVMKNKKNLMINLYGESGTGKTMAAHAIAYELGMKLICVNYADIESKYVGDTSKNLTKLFDYAAKQNVIIFFDEADALLSKRVTEMSSSTDVSVNQTRSVLLTLLNDYQGMVIFTTNFLENYDFAFMRRIQYHVKFELPDSNLRRKLWRMYIPEKMPNDVDFDDIAEKYSNISGCDISNAVLKAALSAAVENKEKVCQSDFEIAIENIINAKKSNSEGDVKTETRKVSKEYVNEQLS